MDKGFGTHGEDGSVQVYIEQRGASFIWMRVLFPFTGDMIDKRKVASNSDLF